MLDTWIRLTPEIDDLADLQLVGIYPWICGLNVLEGDPMSLCNREESISSLDCILVGVGVGVLSLIHI